MSLMKPRKAACPVCRSMEPYTIDRLLVLGYGPRFVAPRFGIGCRAVRKHQLECLVGARREKVTHDLRRMAGVEGEGGS